MQGMTVKCSNSPTLKELNMNMLYLSRSTLSELGNYQIIYYHRISYGAIYGSIPATAGWHFRIMKINYEVSHLEFLKEPTTKWSNHE